MESFSREEATSKRGNFNNKKFTKKESTSNPTCYEYGKPGHMKYDCPNYKKKNDKDEKKGKKDKKGKKAYIAWDENEMSSSSDEDSQSEEANLCLMTSHQSEDEVSDDELCLSFTYDELHDAFEKLHKESLDLAKLVVKQKNLMAQVEK